MKEAVNRGPSGHVVTPEHVLFIQFPCRNITMNKIVAALIASLFAVGAFAQATAPAVAPMTKAAPAAPMAKEAAPMAAKAAPAKKAKVAKKTHKASKPKMDKPAA